MLTDVDVHEPSKWGGACQALLDEGDGEKLDLLYLRQVESLQFLPGSFANGPRYENSLSVFEREVALNVVLRMSAMAAGVDTRCDLVTFEHFHGNTLTSTSTS